MGLWDTVAALGIPDYKDDYYVEETKYNDQLCNIKRASQALSLNDTRSSVFTPSILTDDYLVQDCKEVNPKEIVNEVWFFGAHSDVGGGYKNGKGEMDDDLAQIPLKWMMNNLLNYNLFKNDLLVNETNVNGMLHDAEIDYGPAFKRRNRHIYKYHKYISEYNNGKYKIHRSVIQRLENGIIPIFKHYERQNESIDENGNHLHTQNCSKDWFEDKPFDKCFKKTDKGFQFLETCDSIEIVD